MPPSRKFPVIEKHFGHTFQNESLLVEATTHGKHANGVPVEGRKENTPLAFLGDAVWELVVRRRLMGHEPPLSLKDLNDEADRLVCWPFQSRLARDFGIAAALDFAGSKETDELRKNPKLHSTAFEAVVGALYQDAGHNHAFEILENLIARIEAEPAGLKSS